MLEREKIMTRSGVGVVSVLVVVTVLFLQS